MRTRTSRLPGLFLILCSVGACLSAPTPRQPPEGWLVVDGNQILLPDGTPFRVRGANLPDTRSCNACAYMAANPAEVTRRIDELVDVWHATFIRFVLESYASGDGRVTWQSVLGDPEYLQDIVDVVHHVGTKPGVYVEVVPWIDPSLTVDGWPTAATVDVWEAIAGRLLDEPYVLFGIVDAPQTNPDGSQDAAVWSAMNDVATAIRAVEDAAGKPHHVVVVSGMDGGGRLDYYLDHPITAGGAGDNIAYEVHVAAPPAQFQQIVVEPSVELPVIVGAFANWGGMSIGDCETLIDTAQANDLAWAAWIFHMRCTPELLMDLSGGGCGAGMSLQPNAWGTAVRDRLAAPW